jgi:hypothetical protein
MRTYGGVEVTVLLRTFLTSALVGVNGQLHTPAALFPGKSLWHLLDKKQGGPQSRSVRCGDVKISCSYLEPKSDSSSFQPVVRHYIDWAIPATTINCILSKYTSGIESLTLLNDAEADPQGQLQCSEASRLVITGQVTAIRAMNVRFICNERNATRNPTHNHANKRMQRTVASSVWQNITVSCNC